MNERKMKLSEFADELIARMNQGKTLDCCKKELFRLAEIVKTKLPDEEIKVDWQD